ncbi:MAG TPA: DUF58 domain-containing protein [Candidatus Saccharimonadia bacterium]|nr:DUF58 domain-containing protein [Candidatus Saccharimonadia bacterium]
MAATLRTRLASRWESLLDRAERRLPALTRRRAPEPLPIDLHSRRVYVVPTRFGLLFGLTLVAMLLGALNFNNNGALLLTFVIAGVAQLSLHRTVANLRGIRLESLQGSPVHAGDTAVVSLRFGCGGTARPRVRIVRGADERIVDLAPAGDAIELPLTAERRGWQRAGRFTVSSVHPFGLFHAWSVLNPDQPVLVYPRAEPLAPALPRMAANERGPELRTEGEDWSGLRAYRVGDAPRLIAWKATARQDRLLVKEFSDPMAAEVTLSWNALAHLPHEQRISRLTRWVLDAGAQNLAFRLVLPGSTLGPARGTAHAARCLRELAVLP